MKFTTMKKTAAAILAYLGIAEMPINAENKSVELTAEQQQKLADEFGDDFSEEMINAINTEIKTSMEGSVELKAIQDEIAALLAIAKAEEQQENNPDQDAPEATQENKGELSASEAIKQLEAKYKEQQEVIAKLMQDPEDDVTPTNGKAMKTITLKHSATHLFATNKKWDAFENRPWNMRARDMSAQGTNFNDDAYIPLLEGDVEHFVRENPEALNSLFNQYNTLPKEWAHRTGVLDRVADGYIIPAEVVQSRAPGWSPKNEVLITAEEGRVYRKKIDITFEGYQLQEIENTWIRSYNKEGSHPWKMSFVYFLLSELVKQAAADDCNAQINGIYVANPGGDGKPGRAVNSQNGLLSLYSKYRDYDKKYRPTKLGRPTSENIVDYVKALVLSIPEKDRNSQGLELQLSETIMRMYRERAGFLYQHNYNTDSGKYEYKENHVIDYPNIKFQVLPYMARTEFMAITWSNNIEILDYNTSEKGKFTVTTRRRDVDVFADYRLGIRIKFVGTKISPNDPREFEVQKVWSNDVPIFPSDVYAPIYDKTTGIIEVDYPAVKVEPDWKTDITDIEGVQPGQIVKIYGSKLLAGAKSVKKNAKFKLTADYPLNTDGCLTMIVQSDKTLKEINRTTSAPVINPFKDFEEDVLDTAGASQFSYAGEASATLKDIIGGTEGNQIKIVGSDAEGVELTISKTASIDLDTAAVLKTSTDFIELINVAGTWYELNRKIA